MCRTQGVCFTVLHRTKQGLGVDCVRGNGFCIARKPQKALTPRKTFMHWASVDTFRPGLSVLDAGLPRKVGPCLSLLGSRYQLNMLLVCLTTQSGLAELHARAYRALCFVDGLKQGHKVVQLLHTDQPTTLPKRS